MIAFANSGGTKILIGSWTNGPTAQSSTGVFHHRHGLKTPMQSHLNMVYSAITLIITHSGVNACPLGTAENIIS